MLAQRFLGIVEEAHLCRVIGFERSECDLAVNRNKFSFPTTFNLFFLYLSRPCTIRFYWLKFQLNVCVPVTAALSRTSLVLSLSSLSRTRGVWANGAKGPYIRTSNSVELSSYSLIYILLHSPRGISGKN